MRAARRFPAEKRPFPLKIAGFLAVSRRVPPYPAFLKYVVPGQFPEKGTPCGFGYVALCKDPQMYIDKLSQAVLENALRAGKKRWFTSSP